jgi:ssDNA-binding Zn-finger/Zn-ribbon topoisomerase 1
MPEQEQWFYCKKCGRKLAKQEGDEVIFENHRIKTVLCKFIVCKGYPEECNTVNYLEPERLEARKF